jgi:hypothetical protein
MESYFRAFQKLSLAYRFVAIFSLLLSVFVIYGFFMFYAFGRTDNFFAQDFPNYWLAAHLFVTHKVNILFGPQAGYFRELNALFGPNFPWHNWSYPPHYLLLMLPLALMSYKVGLIVFVMVTGLFFWRALGAHVDTSQMLPIAAMFPVMATNAWFGQNAFLSLGFALFCLSFRANRPVLAGVMLGLLTVKPQLAFMLPCLMLIERRWLVLMSAAGTVAALIALSTWLFGARSWHDYFAIIVPYQSMVMTKFNGPFLSIIPSVYGSLRLAGISAPFALLIHASFAVPIFLIAIFAVIRTQLSDIRDAIVLIATPLITPYILCYDMGFIMAGLVILVMQARGRWDFSGRDRAVFAAAMVMPVAMMISGQFHIGLAPLILYPAFLIAVHRSGALTGAAPLV